jgi:DNA polymerase III delta subunit
VALVRKCQVFQEQGISAEQATVRLGKRSSFPVKKAFAQASSFTADELGSAVVRLAELDHAVKGGSRLAPDLELERALVDVTRRPEPDAAP